MAIGEIPVAVLFCARCNPQLVRWKAGFYGQVTQNDQLVRSKAGFHGQVTQMTNLSGERRALTDEVAFPPLHARDDLHDEKKQGRAAVGKRDEKVRADAYGEQD